MDNAIAARTQLNEISPAKISFNDLVIKAQAISVLTYINITSGSMPANPAITAQLKYGSTNIITI